MTSFFIGSKVINMQMYILIISHSLTSMKMKGTTLSLPMKSVRKRVLLLVYSFSLVSLYLILLYKKGVLLLVYSLSSVSLNLLWLDKKGGTTSSVSLFFSRFTRVQSWQRNVKRWTSPMSNAPSIYPHSNDDWPKWKLTLFLVDNQSGFALYFVRILYFFLPNLTHGNIQPSIMIIIFCHGITNNISRNQLLY